VSDDASANAAAEPEPGFAAWARPWVWPAVLLAALVLRLPPVFFLHEGIDERIYLILARQVHDHGLSAYTLHGTEMWATTTRDMYHPALHYHPPAFVLLLVPLQAWGGPAACAALCALFGVALVVALRALALRRYGLARANLAATIAALCPIGGFLAGRIWLDLPVALGVTAALLAWQWALDRGAAWRFAVAGLAAAIAMLIKLPAVFAAPAFVALGVEALRRGRTPGIWRGVVLFLAVGAAAGLPWFLWHKSATGHWVASWVVNSPTLIENDPFIKEVVSRPWFYYLVTIPLAAPLYLYTVRGIGDSIRHDRDALPTVWFGTYLVLMTLLGVGGYGFPLRFMAPGLPGLALAAAAARGPWNRRRWIQFSAFAAIGLVTWVLNAWVFRYVDPDTTGVEDVFPLPQLLMGWYEGRL